MYRLNTHAVTRKSPAELLFHQNIEDKLLSLKNGEELIEVRDRDKENN